MKIFEELLQHLIYGPCQTSVVLVFLEYGADEDQLVHDNRSSSSRRGRKKIGRFVEHMKEPAEQRSVLPMPFVEQRASPLIVVPNGEALCIRNDTLQHQVS